MENEGFVQIVEIEGIWTMEPNLENPYKFNSKDFENE